MPENNSNARRNRPIPELTPKLIARFWSRIEIRGENECWPWTATLNDSGYGIMAIGILNYRATRIALVIKTGEDPGELSAIHICENNPAFIGRLCTNPSHLEPGTQQENMAYVVGRPRPEAGHPGGENPNATITDEQAIELLNLYATGETRTALAKRFGIGTAMVSHITTGRNWKHLQVDPALRVTGPSGGYKVTPEQILEIHRLRATGLSQQKIANIIGVLNQSMVSKILLGQAHKPKH